MIRTKTILTGLLCICLWAAPAPAETIAVVGGTVHTVSGDVIAQGTVVMADGKIVTVSSDPDVPSDAQVVDATGLHVYPGMISASTVLGLVEVSSVKGTRDDSESGNLNPNIRAKTGINPDSELIPVTRANGVLTVLTHPNGGVISGRSVVWNLQGWTWEDWTVLDEAALHIRWPDMVKVTSWWNQKSEEDQKKERVEKLQELTDAFENAQAYRKAREAMNQGGAHHPMDVRWEGMLPALRGEQKVFIHADEYQQIESALDFASEQGLDIVLVGGRDAPKLADRIAAEDVPVIISQVTNLPRRSWEPYDACYTVAAELHAAGVQYCIALGGSGFGAANIRNLPYQAAMAASFGLPKDEALKSITLHAANILGVGDRLGSIDVGKDANLIITNGDPLEIRTNVVYAFIAGTPVDLSSRHTQLYDKYRNRPRPGDSETRLTPASGSGR